MIIKCLQILCEKTNVINVDLTELNLFNPDIIYSDDINKKKCLDNFNNIFNVIYSNI